LRAIRSKLYDLLTKGITADMIFQVLTREFLKPAQGGQKMGGGIPEFIKPEVLRYAVVFDHRCKDGAKAIIHLEAFLARVMCLYKGAM
jgi:replication factor C subunit 3/5